MRLLLRGRVQVTWQGREMLAALRPLRGGLAAMPQGEYAQEQLRLLLPWDAGIAPGDRVGVGGAPYVCAAVARYKGHTQADVRRCVR